MKTSGLLVCALATLTSFTSAAPAIGHELQHVLQDVGQAAASPFEAWRSDDEVDVEKHKKKKTKTKTKYKTKTEATTSFLTRTTCPHHGHSSTTRITPTPTKTSTKPGLPPIIPPPRTSSSSSSSSTKKHKHSTTTVSPSPTRTSTKPGVPPIIPPPRPTPSSSSHSHASPTSSVEATPTTTPGAIPTSGPIDSDLVRNVLKKAQVIPSVIDDFHPSFLINTTFPHTHSPFLGRAVSPDYVQEAPRIALYPPESRSNDSSEVVADLPMNNIVITLTDPDAPSHKDPKWSEICHWIAVGLPVRADPESTSASVDEFEILHEVMPFKPPGPPPKTGPHRYVLLAFTPRNATTEPLHLEEPSGRQHWGYEDAGHGVRDWAMEMGLLPIAGDFFTAENES